MNDYKFHPLFKVFLEILANNRRIEGFLSMNLKEILPMMPGCEFGLGDHVVKAKEDKPGDTTPLGTEGIVIGGM